MGRTQTVLWLLRRRITHNVRGRGAFEGSRHATTTPDMKSGKWALVVNAGSSSLKYALFSLPKPRPNLVTQPSSGGTRCGTQANLRPVQLANGSVSEIGGQSVVKQKTHAGKGTSYTANVKDHRAAFGEMLKLITDPSAGLMKHQSDISVVGHRVVHGADKFSSAAVITKEVEDAIEDAARLAPLHNPANLIGIREAKHIFECPHVAVFDTAFHTSIPPESYTYGVPLDIAVKHKIRRYGFHGTSYCFVLAQTAELLSKRTSELNCIIMHLGNGASMACIRKGVCIDTTMGLTPLEGLLMGTRSGDLDPGVYTHLTKMGMTPDEIDTMLNKKSGLLGLCGKSNMQEVIAGVDAGEATAQLALDIFVQRVRKYLGSYMVRLNGEVDAIVFTGGIGENSDRVRALVCHGLDPLGIAMDVTKNERPRQHNHIVSLGHSHTKILVIPTDEELAIVMQSVSTAKLPLTEETIPAAPSLKEQQQTPHVAVAGSSLEAKAAEALRAKANGVYICAANRNIVTDSSVPEVGLMTALVPRVSSVGYFRPLAYNEQDRRIDLIRNVFSIVDKQEDMYGVTWSTAQHMMAAGEQDKMIQDIMQKFEACREKHDFVVVSGLNQNEMPAGDHQLNTKLADALNLPMIWSTDAAANATPGMSRVGSVVEEINMIRPKDAYKHVPLLGVIVSETPSRRLEPITEKTTKALADMGIKTIAVLPADNRLRMRTMREVANVLGATILAGSDALDSNHVGKMIVATLQVPDLISVIMRRGEEEDHSLLSNVSKEAEIEILKKAFDKFDKRGNGTILVEELGLLLRGLGWDASDAEIRRIVHECGEGFDGPNIDFPQFMRFMTQQDQEPMMGGSFLIVTHIGRVDLLLSLLMASRSKFFPKIGGILLTDAGGLHGLTQEVKHILSGENLRVPVMSIPLDTFQATQRIHGLHGLAPRLLPTSKTKLSAASEIFERYASASFMDAMLHGKDVRREMTSRQFQYSIFRVAKNNKMRIVLPEGEDWRVVVAASELLARDLCHLTILGKREDVLTLAKQHNANVDRATIINPVDADDFEAAVAELVKLREKKGMTDVAARRFLRDDFTWYATMMMHMGKCDGMVSGACHTTADTMRPAMQIIKTAPGCQLVSSCFFMLLPDRVYIFADCAINVNPSSDDLCQIALSSASTARAFGIEPRVAMLSYATGESNTGPMIDKVRSATEAAQKLSPDLMIEGPTQFDAAVDMDVAAVKMKGKTSSVAGRANVCIFPDLNTGNNTYKAVQQAARCVAVGPISQGLRLPVNDLSRGCTVEDVVNTVVITCNQAIAARQQDAAGAAASK